LPRASTPRASARASPTSPRTPKTSSATSPESRPRPVKALKDIGPTIRPTIKTLVELVGAASDLVDWFDKSEKSYTKFHDVNKSFKKDSQDLDDFFKDRSDSIQRSFDQLGSFFADRGKSINLTFAQISSFVSDRIASVKKSFAQLGAIPGQLATIGGQIVSGFVGGITDAWGAVTSTISSLVNAIPEGVRKLLGIASPSKVFHLIGTQVGQGLHKGLLGSVDQIKEASQRMVDAVRSGFTGSGVSAITRYIQRDAKALEEMSKYRGKWIDRLATDQDRLKSILADRASFAAGVKANVMGNADTSSIFGTSMQTQRDARQAAYDFNVEVQRSNAEAIKTARGVTQGAGLATLNGVAYQPSWTTAGPAARLQATRAIPKVSAHAGLAAVRANLKSLLADTKKFSSNLKKLVHHGIDPYTYDELVQAGVRGGGLETSTALLADPALSRQIFSLERQVASAGRSLGTRTAGHEYAGQVAAARARVATDQAEVHNYNIAMTVTAKDIDDLGKLVRMFGHVRATARKGKKK
jgi:hypothetical protein